MTARFVVNRIRQLDENDFTSPCKERLGKNNSTGLRAEDLVFHIMDLDPDAFPEGKKPKGNKAQLVDELYRILMELRDDEDDESKEQAEGTDISLLFQYPIPYA